MGRIKKIAIHRLKSHLNGKGLLKGSNAADRTFK
jgi:hypothetical protein